MGKSGPAKRALLRPPLRIECTREGRRGTYFLGYAANLSETGVFVQCLAPRPPGTRLRLVLHLAGSKGPEIQTDAEVRWTRGYRGKRAASAGMGLRFTSLKPSDRSILQAMCAAPAFVEAAEIRPHFKTEKRSDG
jgi:uncharacterized protein (TIGR02266 family)